MSKYYPSPDDLLRSANNFRHHPPTEEQQFRYEIIRHAAAQFALLLMVNCPPSRERQIALTELETAMMWANASIARNE